MIDEMKVIRVLAWLLRNEGVEPREVERAVASAVDMRVGESAALDGDEIAPLRRAFLSEQVERLK